jgi:hypothetical protein
MELGQDTMAGFGISCTDSSRSASTVLVILWGMRYYDGLIVHVFHRLSE